MSWRDRAWPELRRLAEAGEPFTSDDLIALVGVPDDAHTVNARNSAIGSLFREAARRRLIVPVGVDQSKQPHRKGGMVRIWRGARRG